MENKKALKNFTEAEMKEFMKEIGEKAFRGTQVYSWIYKGAKTFDDMKNIPKSLREKLEEVSYIGNIDIELKLESKDGKTKKYLFLLNDGNIIETVMMDYDSRVTVCVSNQVGCRMGCRFCASTMDGLVRNLEPWEILDQIMKIQEDTGKRVSNLVLMGSGEPLDNYDNTKQFLKIFMKEIGEKAFRGTQVYSWIYKGAKTFDDMKNIPKSLREKLEEVSYIGNIDIELKLESKDGKTKKYLFLLNDGNIIETVMMDYDSRVTVCVSNQVGCRMGCRFCASTMDGLVRNLEPWEILDQIMKIQEDTGKRVSNLVLMGSGEPLDNYDNTKQFLKIVNDENGLNIGYRHITLSTCGIVPKIYELADLEIPINLAISLHSPYDEKRKEIMPVANKYSIKEILDACRYYIKKTNRRVTFEYSLIKGVNDGKKEAEALASLLKGMLCHVNLIPINEVDERDFKKPDKAFIYKFRDYLEERNIPATVRISMGSDISGACGQLRRKHK